MNHFKTSNVITINGVRADTLADKYDTPLYVTDAHVICQQFHDIHAAFSAYQPTLVSYACKANSNVTILRLLHQLGASIDCVSPGEVKQALRAGFTPDRITFTGTNPRNDELDYLLSTSIKMNIDSISMARRLSEKTSNRDFSIRINPHVGAGHHEHVNTGIEESKFGLHENDIASVVAILSKANNRINMVHAHIGSGIMEPSPYRVLIDEMARVVKDLEMVHHQIITTVDIGGGFGIPYSPTEKPIDIAQFAKAISERFKECLPNKTMMIEPGRFIIAQSTVLITRINTVKTTPINTFLGVDAGFNTLIRPSMYGSYHHILPATKLDQPFDHTYSICGPICETGDVFGHGRQLPEMNEGDLLVIGDTGAYGYTMASGYNMRGRPAEVMVSHGIDYLMRKAESFDDLISLETNVAIEADDPSEVA